MSNYVIFQSGEQEPEGVAIDTLPQGALFRCGDYFGQVQDVVSPDFSSNRKIGALLGSGMMLNPGEKVFLLKPGDSLTVTQRD